MPASDVRETTSTRTPGADRWARSAPPSPTAGTGTTTWRLLRGLGRQPTWAIVVEAFSLTALIAILDHLTGSDYAWSIFYVAPILLVTWYVSWRAGAAWALMSAAIWVIIDAAGRGYSSAFVPVWNAIVRLAFFALVTALVEGAKRGLARERTLSRTDALTGVANSRSFEDRLTYSLDYLRRTRRPVTLAYVDLDEFKTVNDRLGHFEGDALLRAVAVAIDGRLRATDMVARLGGDEFGILLPDTDETTALLVLESVVTATRDAVTTRWPVSMTIGAVTFREAPPDIDTMVAAADDLMYVGKRHSKGRIGHAVWSARDDVRLEFDVPAPGADARRLLDLDE
jgi:diguanylate cyclase (GGDEF)-like protein